MAADDDCLATPQRGPVDGIVGADQFAWSTSGRADAFVSGFDSRLLVDIAGGRGGSPIAGM